MTISAHIIDARGVYIRTELVDPMGPQPAGAIYEAPPQLQPGKTRMWIDAAWRHIPVEDVPPIPEAQEKSQFEKDQSRYQKRAAVKNELLAYMATDNLGRVRSGAWTVPQLMSLMDDHAVASTNAYMSTLSYELAAQAIATATTPLLTPEIRANWVGKLQEHFYLEG